MTTIKTDSLKDIKDYLHLYLGCEFIGKYKNWAHENHPMTLCPADLVDGKFEYIKPILRLLFDMTDSEAEELATIHHYDIPDDPGVKEELINIYSNEGELHLGTHYLPVRMYLFGLLWLLKQGFDVFGLIESGLAIEKKPSK